MPLHRPKKLKFSLPKPSAFPFHYGSIAPVLAWPLPEPSPHLGCQIYPQHEEFLNTNNMQIFYALIQTLLITQRFRGDLE